MHFSGFGVLDKSEGFDFFAIFASVVFRNFCESLGKSPVMNKLYFIYFFSVVLCLKKSIILLTGTKVVLEINKLKVALLLYTIQIMPHLRGWVRLGHLPLKKLGLYLRKSMEEHPKIMKILEERKYTQWKPGKPPSLV